MILDTNERPCLAWQQILQSFVDSVHMHGLWPFTEVVPYFCTCFLLVTGKQWPVLKNTNPQEQWESQRNKRWSNDDQAVALRAPCNVTFHWVLGLIPLFLRWHPKNVTLYTFSGSMAPLRFKSMWTCNVTFLRFTLWYSRWWRGGIYTYIPGFCWKSMEISKLAF